MRVRVILRSIIIGTFFAFYPYLVYKGVQAGVVWFAPILIATLYLYQAVIAKNRRVRVKNLALVSILLAGCFYFPALMAKLIPIFVQFSLMLFFGKTLFKSKAPSLVERFAEIDFPEIPPVVSRYCWYVTLMWASFFAFNVVTCIALALFAPVSWWAIFTGVLIFALSTLLMVMEYIVRHFYFRRLDPELQAQIPSVKESMRSMVVNGKQIWLSVGER
ncbi:MAG: hypothetical protein GQ582_09275 [Methyloprofundus sp.]|nr:hypothetical protein [Methyloprofundus sp.]